MSRICAGGAECAGGANSGKSVLRHPMPTAMQMATLAEAAPGRVAIAVGIGNPLFLGESGETIDKPVRVIREFVEALRALWSGEPSRRRLTGSVSTAPV